MNKDFLKELSVMLEEIQQAYSDYDFDNTDESDDEEEMSMVVNESMSSIEEIQAKIRNFI